MKITWKNIFRYELLILIMGCVIMGGISSLPSEAGQKSKAAQKSWDFVPTPEYNEAGELMAMGHYDEALDKFREIAKKNPGTPLAAECQFKIAYLSDKNRALQEYEDIVKSYPESRYELDARTGIIDIKYLSDFDTWLAKNNELITSVGGKSICEIIGLNPSTNRGSPQNIPQEYRDSVASIYLDAGATMMNYNITYGKNDPRGNPSSPLYIPGYDMSHRKNDPNKLDQAFKMLTYVRENFPTSPSCAIASNEISGRGGIFEEWGFRGTEVDTKPPTIECISPQSDNIYIMWRRPIFRYLMYDGDINQSQIDLANLEFKFDGVDLKDKMKTKIYTLRPHSPRDAKKIVEKIFIWYRPEKPLSRGVHTIYFNVKDYAGNSIEGKNTFKITTPRKEIEEDDPSWIDRILKELNGK